MLVGEAVWAVHPGNPGFRKGSAITTFSQTLTLVAGLLCLGKRVSYRRLRKEFGLDDETLEDVRHELIVMRLAVDEGGQGLAFVGTAPFETGNAPPRVSCTGRRADRSVAGFVCVCRDARAKCSGPRGCAGRARFARRPAANPMSKRPALRSVPSARSNIQAQNDDHQPQVEYRIGRRDARPARAARLSRQRVAPTGAIAVVKASPSVICGKSRSPAVARRLARQTPATAPVTAYMTAPGASARGRPPMLSRPFNRV